MPLKKGQKSPNQGPVKRRSRLTPAIRKKYLEEYSQTGLKNHSAGLAGCSYSAIATYRDKHPEFKAQEDEAYEKYRESLIKEAQRRGKQGIEQEVFGTLPGKNAGTGVVGTRRVYSDKMLELVIKRDDPKYREASQYRKVDQNTTHSGFVGSATIDTSKLNTEEKKQLLDLLQKARPEDDTEKVDE